MTGKALRTQGSRQWWDFWKERLGQHPVAAEIKFDIKSLTEISIETMSWGGSVMIDVRVRAKDLYPDNELIPDDELGYVVEVEPGIFVDQWDPTIVVSNLVVGSDDYKKWKWITHDPVDGEECLVYHNEIHGSFKLNSTAFFYPVDDHVLTIDVTSDFSNNFLRFIPWGDYTSLMKEYNENVFDLPHTFSTRLRQENYGRVIERRLYGLLGRFEIDDRVKVGVGREQGRKFYYSNAKGILYVHRKPLLTLFLEGVRPFVLTSLGFVCFAVDPNDPSALEARLGIVLTLVVASSFAILRQRTAFWAITDVYITLSFVLLCIIATFTVLIATDVFDTDRDNADRIAGIILGIAWAGLNAIFVFVAFGKYLKNKWIYSTGGPDISRSTLDIVDHRRESVPVVTTPVDEDDMA